MDKVKATYISRENNQNQLAVPAGLQHIHTAISSGISNQITSVLTGNTQGAFILSLQNTRNLKQNKCLMQIGTVYEPACKTSSHTKIPETTHTGSSCSPISFSLFMYLSTFRSSSSNICVSLFLWLSYSFPIHGIWGSRLVWTQIIYHVGRAMLFSTQWREQFYEHWETIEAHLHTADIFQDNPWWRPLPLPPRDNPF